MLHKNLAETQPKKGRIERGVSQCYMLLKVVESLWAYQNAYCSCDIDAVHGWLVHVQEMLWSLVHPWLVLVCIVVLVTFRFIGLAHLHSLSGCLAFVGFPLGFGLVCLGLCPLVSLFAVLVGFSLGCLHLWCGLGALASRRRAFVVGCCGGCCGCCCGCPLALRCLFGGSSDQSSQQDRRTLW